MNTPYSTNVIDPVLTIAQVSKAVSYSPSQIYRKVADGTFPAPVRLGVGRIGWRQSDIIRWLDSRPIAAGFPSSAIPGSDPVLTSAMGGL